MANLKNITELPVAESADGLNLIVNDNGVAKQIAASEVGLSVYGAQVGQVVKISAVDYNGRPTAWEPANLPTKLSELENDLWYSKVTPMLTLTRDDFIPRYCLDNNGNPTEEVECYYYRGTPALKWFTSLDKIGFSITATFEGETEIYNHNIPNAENGYDHTEWMFGEKPGDGMLFSFCDDCGVAVATGLNFFSNTDLVPEDAFYVQTYWYNEDGVGFDSITIYQIDEKKVPIEYCDTSEIEAELNMVLHGEGD